MSTSFQIGDLFLQRYELLRSIGRGASAEVILAQDKELNRAVAIKLLHSFSKGEAREDHLLRFKREARLLSKLRHPNIVEIYAFGFADQILPYLVMEYVEGKTLRQVLDEEANLSVDKALALSKQIVEALKAMHAAGMVHRDLKPENILVQEVDNKSFIKLVDFGLCKQLSEVKQKELTMTGMIMGTAFYMSPEQCLAKDLNPQSDIYSFGCMFFEMLTGFPPHTGENLSEIMLKHVHEQQPTLHSLQPATKLPKEIDSFIESCLMKDREKRPSDANQLGERLVQLESLQCQERLTPPAASAMVDRSKQRVLSKKAILVILSTILFLLLGSNYWLPSKEGRQTYLKYLSQVLSPNQATNLILAGVESQLNSTSAQEALAYALEAYNQEGVNSWKPAQRIRLLEGIFEKFRKFGKNAEAKAIAFAILTETTGTIWDIHCVAKSSVPPELMQSLNQVSVFFLKTENSREEWIEIRKILNPFSIRKQARNLPGMAKTNELLAEAELHLVYDRGDFWSMENALSYLVSAAHSAYYEKSPAELKRLKERVIFYNKNHKHKQPTVVAHMLYARYLAENGNFVDATKEIDQALIPLQNRITSGDLQSLKDIRQIIEHGTRAATSAGGQHP